MSAPAINDGIIRLTCAHSNHLFAHPLCEKQTLLKRIANVAFHILTLGIPLAIYKIHSCYYSKKAPTQENGNLQGAGIQSVQQNIVIQHYSALAFARKKLAEHADIQPKQWSAQPVNQEIACLANLYWNVAYKNFEDLLKQHEGNNPWSHQEVINAADTCMKIAYAISNLTLDDLKAFTKTRVFEGEKRTYVQALTAQTNSYQYRTFFYFTNIYHLVRGAGAWACELGEDGGIDYPDTISKEHADLFYKNGTVQNSWNSLYNEYCDRVRLYVKEKDLQKADPRHVNWTQKDTDAKRETFRAVPDTQPT